MLAKVASAACHGVDGFPVQVEVDLSAGLPTFSTVGLPDAAVRESKDRVVAALRNSGFDVPVRKITVNLSPADVKKEGTAFDLPIALGLLAADERIPEEILKSHVFVGELALDGRVKPVKGLLPIALSVRALGGKKLVCPGANGAEAGLVQGLETVPVHSLREAVDYLRGESPAPAAEPAAVPAAPGEDMPDFSDVKGQLFVKRALEVAAAGGHNILMIGPPGSGKTLMARRLPGILPPLHFEEALEATKIHSVMGLVRRGHALLGERPFRSPHHTISHVALVGGGAHPRPGEVSLAHHGVLFLDELPEFDRDALEVLRQPLEEGSVTIARAAHSLTFPARFMLVAAMNPCPCGYLGHPDRDCVCSPFHVQKYRSRISGPLLDRIDLHVEVPALRVMELTEEQSPSEPSEHIRRRVLAARDRQLKRFAGTGVHSNAQMDAKSVKKHCRLDAASKDLLKTAVQRLHLSARSFDRILKVARTAADLEGAESIAAAHVAEAVGFRSFDRN